MALCPFVCVCMCVYVGGLHVGLVVGVVEKLGIVELLIGPLPALAAEGARGGGSLIESGRASGAVQSHVGTGSGGPIGQPAARGMLRVGDAAACQLWLPLQAVVAVLAAPAVVVVVSVIVVVVVRRLDCAGSRAGIGLAVGETTQAALARVHQLGGGVAVTDGWVRLMIAAIRRRFG